MCVCVCMYESVCVRFCLYQSIPTNRFCEDHTPADFISEFCSNVRGPCIYQQCDDVS